jgi:hypothetical protein
MIGALDEIQTKVLIVFLFAIHSHHHRVHIFTRDENRVSVSVGAYTATLLVMVNVIKGGWACTPRPSPGQANFTLMTECTPESRRYYSVYSVVTTTALPWDFYFFKIT